MYLPSTEQCSGLPNSTNSPSAADIARRMAVLNSIDTAKATANQDWLGLLSRDWRSFVDQGPHVAAQAINGQPKINTVSIATGIVLGDPSRARRVSGVDLVTEGNPDQSTPGKGGSGAARPASAHDSPSIKTSGGQVLPADFVSTFGYRGPEQKTYTGPLPKQGSVLSLVMGQGLKLAGLGIRRKLPKCCWSESNSHRGT